MLRWQPFMLNSHVLLKSNFLCVAVQMFERGLSAHCDVDSSRSLSESYTQVNISDNTHRMFSTEANRAAGVEATLVFHVYHRPSDSRSCFFSPVKCDLSVQTAVTFKKVQYRSDPSIWKWPESGLKMSDSI